jgi:predicted esterase
MNSRSYVETIVAQWPDLAKRFILIGINGEQRNADSPPEAPTYNYTYVNYVGRSKFKGYPGTDRESPALVAEVIEELKNRHRFSRVFVGGHSQGGFLTYSIMMNSPKLIDGAFPMSSGLIVQCEPGAYDDAAVIAAQKRVPLAIVHGRTDPVVDFSMSRYAHEAFDDAGFEMLRLFPHESAGHRFAFLPLMEAIDWLEMMSDTDAGNVLASAEDAVKRLAWRDAVALSHRLGAMDLDDQQQLLATKLQAQIDEAAAAAAAPLRQRMRDNAGNGWVDEYLAFREQFGSTGAAESLVEAYASLRAEHQPAADELFNQSRGDFQRGDQDAGYAKYQQIVDDHYASSWYRLCKRYLDERGK